jgi:hypothetical protein
MFLSTPMGRDILRGVPARSTCYLPAAPPARHGLEDLYLFAVFADDQMADVDEALVAGVGVLVVVEVEIMISGRWVRWVRGILIHVNLLSRLAGSRGVRGFCGAICVLAPSILLLYNRPCQTMIRQDHP